MFGVGGRIINTAGVAISGVNFTGQSLQHTKSGPGSTLGAFTDDGTTMMCVGGTDGSDTTVLTSTDGSTWTERSPGDNSGSHDCAFGNGHWVVSPIAGLGCRETLDPTGGTWNGRTVFGSGFFFTQRLIYDTTLGLFIVGGTDLTSARLATSPDGITWTERTIPATLGNISDIYRSSNNTMVACGNDSGTAKYTTSTDAITWGTPTAFDDGTGSQPQTMLYDSALDRHYVMTDTQLGYIGNNSGPPAVSDFNLISTSVGGGTQGKMIQPFAGGPIIWQSSVTDLLRWTNDFSTVDTFDQNPPITVPFNVFYWPVDGEYYTACYAGGLTGYIHRLTQS